jgi:hypothetical protein
MSKRALRLHQLHSREELVAMLERVTNDPESQAKDGGIHLYTRKARKLIDDITWAIYWHGAPQGNTRMTANGPQAKWW